MRSLVIKFLRWYIGEHPFKPSMIIKKANSKVLYEVEECYYTKNFEQVLICRHYATDRVVSVSGVDLLEYIEHKGIAPDTVEF